jgi:hypothetical protein
MSDEERQGELALAQRRDNSYRRYFYGVAAIKRIITTCGCGVRFCHTAPNQTLCEACRTGEPGEV